MDIKSVIIRKNISNSSVNELISNWIKLLDDTYLGNSYPHNWKCLCGETINGRQWSNIRFRNDIKCEKCVKQKISDRYKSEVEKVDGYKFIKAYFVGDTLPNGDIVKRYPCIEIKHEYCSSKYTIRANNFIGANQCCSNCCGSYENSLAYYIEVTLGETLEKYLDLEKCEHNPYFLSKGSEKEIWHFCQKKEYHGSSPIRCSDFIRGTKRNSGCKFCRNNDTHHLDSVGHLYPNICKNIISDIDVFSLKPQSNIPIYYKCLDCGSKSNQTVDLCNLVNQGYTCKVCGDGVPLPEKFLYNILLYINVNFSHRITFDWSDNKEYDFYVPHLNIIIETHGDQHYNDKVSFGSTTLKDQQDNDEYKYILATKNIPKENYYIVDCRMSKFDYLKDNVTKTLGDIFDFSNVNWSLIWKNSQKSLVIQTWDLWNSGIRNAMLIANELGISRNTTIDYLKRGSKFGFCDYNPKEEMRKSALSNANNKTLLNLISTDNIIKPFPSIISIQQELDISRRCFDKIIENNGIIDINIFSHTKVKNKLLIYNGYKIEKIADKD